MDFQELPVPERIALIERIWDSINEEAFSLTESQKEDLERRLARRDRSRASSWDDVKRRIIGES